MSPKMKDEGELNKFKNTKYTSNDFYQVIATHYIERKTWPESCEGVMSFGNFIKYRHKRDQRYLDAIERFNKEMEEESIPTAYATLLREAKKGSVPAAKIILEMAGKFKRDYTVNVNAKILPIPVYAELPDAKVTDLQIEDSVKQALPAIEAEAEVDAEEEENDS